MKRHLVFIVVAFLIQSSSAQTTSTLAKSSQGLAFEFGRLWNTGAVNEGLYSGALRFGVSGSWIVPIHSSLDFGVLENHRRKYTRFNIIGYGIQPDVIMSGRRGYGVFARADIFCLTIAETGYAALTPGAEIGGTLRITDEISLLLTLRHSVDIADGRASMSSVQIGAIGAIAGAR